MQKSSHPEPGSLMLSITRESLALVREVMIESKATLEPVIKVSRGRGRKPSHKANQLLLNVLALDRSSLEAEALTRALPEFFQNEKARIYLRSDEFHALLALVKAKTTPGQPGCKWHNFWRQMAMAEMAYEEKYGPMA